MIESLNKTDIYLSASRKSLSNPGWNSCLQPAGSPTPSSPLLRHPSHVACTGSCLNIMSPCHRREGGSMTPPKKTPPWNLHTPLLFISLRLELSHIGLPNCKGSWEIGSLFWKAICPVKCQRVLLLSKKGSRKTGEWPAFFPTFFKVSQHWGSLSRPHHSLPSAGADPRSCGHSGHPLAVRLQGMGPKVYRKLGLDKLYALSGIGT